MLVENRFSKYLLYAFGEIILVVIGILIALQINNWNENRKNRIQETAILTNLKEEFQSNLQELKEDTQTHIFIQQACSQLLELTSPNPKNYNPHTLDSLLGISYISPRFNYKDGALQSLINSGRLTLIRTKVLRNKIAQFPGLIADAGVTETTLREIS